MIAVTAEQFWTKYRESLRHTLWKDYCTRAWTPVAVNAAKQTIGEFGLRTEVGYNTCVTTLLDAVGYEWRHCYDWTFRIAFEHELKVGDWKRELCKLTQIVADLRVLVAYHNPHGRSDARRRFQEHVDLLGNKKMKLGGAEWLLVMGPSTSTTSEPYQAFTVSERGQVEKLEDELPLVPTPASP